jgi:hypothetical protein
MTNPEDPSESGRSYEFPPLDNTRPAPESVPFDYPSGYPPMPPPVYPAPYPVNVGYPYGSYPGYPHDPYDPYRPVAPAGTNSKAIAALVTSLAGLIFCGLPSIAGIILGIIAMRETKRTGQDGFGMAVAGVVVGSAIVALIIVYIVFVALIAANSGPDYVNM